MGVACFSVFVVDFLKRNWDDAVKYLSNNDLTGCMKAAGPEVCPCWLIRPTYGSSDVWMWNSVLMKSSVLIVLDETRLKTQWRTHTYRLQHVICCTSNKCHLLLVHLRHWLAFVACFVRPTIQNPKKFNVHRHKIEKRSHLRSWNKKIKKNVSFSHVSS